jgi:hypothetical protein
VRKKYKDRKKEKKKRKKLQHKQRKKNNEQKKQRRKKKRNGSMEGRSSSELESFVGLFGKVKDGVGCANVGQDRERMGMVGDK